jgi:anti-sigma28 factor (negative regulator of flagellin synthesis)
MISTDIVNEIARLMAQRELSLKDPKEAKQLKAQKGMIAPQDQVTLSSVGKSYASAAGSTSELEKEQGMKVERLKALVGDGNYKMDHQMVETIAERIANMLV